MTRERKNELIETLLQERAEMHHAYGKYNTGQAERFYAALDTFRKSGRLSRDMRRHMEFELRQHLELYPEEA